VERERVRWRFPRASRERSWETHARPLPYCRGNEWQALALHRLFVHRPPLRPLLIAPTSYCTPYCSPRRWCCTASSSTASTAAASAPAPRPPRAARRRESLSISLCLPLWSRHLYGHFSGPRQAFRPSWTQGCLRRTRSFSSWRRSSGVRCWTTSRLKQRWSVAMVFCQQFC
jgi:hypothetical protein